MISQSLVPSSSTQITATIWLNNYCKGFGDHQPNNNIICISVNDKKDLWEEYRDNMLKIDEEFVCYQRFLVIWNSIYPNYQLRQQGNVVGKCKTCYEIDSIRKTTKDPIQLEAAKELHHLHKGNFMSERLR